MKQPPAPTQLQTETPLLTRSQLKKWLAVSDMWIRMRLDDPEFVDHCVIDIATRGSSQRKLRFPARAVADYLGIPDYATPQLAIAA
ncbi:hypothetical protein [Streptomyces mirabilis]|uniref:hypothetical protein n=1 Tax=Streptomyces mirabilis TaxID=68239 RepID=UPI0033E758D4